ncbi:hypothetical protein O181_056941 [Austropuccinia psidii MF-1]|uniref:Uncharacterized protein n=1 Tax=Austropuccinia psidii MF-1 TaxID=1389203 RepID=A0A9Q3HTG4_9BASI|nr:hypothetical protein [Austropuccinia psidii MF-1]
MVLYTILHPFSPVIQWCQHQKDHSTFHKSPKCHVIQRTHQGSSSGVIPQRPMTPSEIHWIFSLQVFPPREYHQFIPKFQFSINPAWQSHSFQYSLDSSRRVFQSYIMGKIIQCTSFPNLARYTLYQSVNTASTIQ